MYERSHVRLKIKIYTKFTKVLEFRFAWNQRKRKIGIQNVADATKLEGNRY